MINHNLFFIVKSKDVSVLPKANQVRTEFLFNQAEAKARVKEVTENPKAYVIQLVDGEDFCQCWFPKHKKGMIGALADLANGDVEALTKSATLEAPTNHSKS